MSLSPDDFALYSRKLHDIAIHLGCPEDQCQPGMVLFQRAGAGWMLYAGIWCSDVLEVPKDVNYRLGAIDALHAQVEPR